MTDTTMAEAFRLSDVLSRAFAIYARRVVPFSLLTLIASIPNYLLMFATRNAPEVTGIVSVPNVALGVVFLVTHELTSAAVIYGVVQELRGQKFSVADSIQVALHRLFPIIGVAVWGSLAIVPSILVLAVPVPIALALVVVPAGICACMFYVAMPACIAERTGVFASLSRSSFLTAGHRWRILGMFVLIAVLALLFERITWMIAAPAGEIGTLIFPRALELVENAFNGVLVGVFYYRLRVAKEGTDIDRIASVFA